MKLPISLLLHNMSTPAILREPVLSHSKSNTPTRRTTRQLSVRQLKTAGITNKERRLPALKSLFVAKKLHNGRVITIRRTTRTARITLQKTQQEWLLRMQSEQSIFGRDVSVAENLQETMVIILPIPKKPKSLRSWAEEPLSSKSGIFLDTFTDGSRVALHSIRKCGSASGGS